MYPVVAHDESPATDSSEQVGAADVDCLAENTPAEGTFMAGELVPAVLAASLIHEHSRVQAWDPCIATRECVTANLANFADDAEAAEADVGSEATAEFAGLETADADADEQP